jgi:hypothetical protein
MDVMIDDGYLAHGKGTDSPDDRYIGQVMDL